jgi:hypothetical protein
MSRIKHRGTAVLFAAAALCLGLMALPVAAQEPLQVGDHFPILIDSSGRSDVETVGTDTGRVYTLTHEGATYIAVHFESFNLAPGDWLRVTDATGGQEYTLRGKGKMEAGSFWSQHVKGDTIVLELVTAGDTFGRGFRIDQYAAGFVSLGGPEAICGANDKRNAVCYQTSHPVEYERGRSVARLLIQGGSLCTGWLASASSHLITNEHCISSATAALNTDYEFMAEAPTCGSGNCQLCWTGDIFSGATFLKDSPALDYALVQITIGDPASSYGYLSIDDRDAMVGEEIYIPQHPGGRAKEFGIESSHSQDGGLCHVTTFAPGCSSSSYSDVGYQCDTEGGSSGSPVLARSSHQVIALHHCANCPNRGVPIDLVCAEICGLLGPECTTDADCDDGDPCTDDVCLDNNCTNDPTLGVCCGNGTCESGEDCNSCLADCISGGGGSAQCGNGVCEPSAGEDCLSCEADCNGKQNGNPRNRFCCGDGAGEKPVDCGDSRCSSGGFACGDPPPPYCCGDGFCEGNEDNTNCAIDCPPPFCGDGNCDPGEECSCAADCGTPPATETACSDGVDNDCDGLTDSADPDCVCGAKNDLCNTGADCCSGSCKPNGRCR